MSVRKPTTHVLIERELVLAKRPNSEIWQCRYKVDKAWQHTSTGEYDLKLAKKKAHEILMEAHVRKKMNVAPITRRFKDVARSAVKRMEDDLAGGNGLVGYKDYIVAIDRYLTPILGSYNVDSIDYAVLDILNEKRALKMGKTPTKSTLLTHNAALNRVFDEAVYRGYMTESQRPKLVAKGKKTERRIEFSLEEVRAIKQNFDAWIERARADARPVRELLRDYVEVLLNTGARPGKELLTLRWTQIERLITAEVKETDRRDELGDEEVDLKVFSQVVLKIQNGKTGARQAVGGVETVRALNGIAKRNYDASLTDLIKSGIKDPIFRYKEWLNKEEIAAKQKPAFIEPTSFVKLFNTYLTEHNLLYDAVTDKKRTFYSLRHTYATLALTHDSVAIHTLAKQMGTSVAMIEKHYSHLEPVKAIHQLRGEETRQLISASKKIDEKYVFDETKEKRKRSSKK
jgi:integrase